LPFDLLIALGFDLAVKPPSAFLCYTHYVHFMISFGLVLVFLICNISRILILYDIILCVVVHNTILCMVFEGFYIPHSLTILATKRKQRIVIF